jgi:hypothetical protein
VRCGTTWGQFVALGRAVLKDIGAGRPVRRRDAVIVLRVLEGVVVRAAAAVLEADERELLPRLVELLNAVLVGADERAAEACQRGKPPG